MVAGWGTLNLETQAMDASGMSRSLLISVPSIQWRPENSHGGYRIRLTFIGLPKRMATMMPHHCEEIWIMEIGNIEAHRVNFVRCKLLYMCMLIRVAQSWFLML